MKDNYKKADFTVVLMPDHVASECPYCKEDFKMDYDEFTIDGDPYEAEGTTVECRYCEGEIFVNSVDWD